MNSFEVKRVDIWDGGDRHNFGFYINAQVLDAALVMEVEKALAIAKKGIASL